MAEELIEKRGMPVYHIYCDWLVQKEREHDHKITNAYAEKACLNPANEN